MNREQALEVGDIVELTPDQIVECHGGDWWGFMMGAMLGAAFLAGSTASAPLLATSVVIGGAILATDTLLTWY